MDSKFEGKSLNRSLIIYITFIIILSITSVIAVSRKSAETREVKNKASDFVKTDAYRSPELNKTEADAMALLMNSPQIINHLSEDSQWSLAHLNYLSEYLSRKGVSLSPRSLEDIKELIRGKEEVLLFEKKTDINEMSIEGRRLILYLYEKIYHLCGLSIAFDAESNIERIVDQSGDIIYENSDPKSQPRFHAEVFAITVICILILIILGYIIAKKNQMFIKGGKYDGFDEKEYA